MTFDEKVREEAERFANHMKMGILEDEAGRLGASFMSGAAFGAALAREEQEADVRVLREALNQIIEEDGHFRMDAGVVDGQFAKIARKALEVVKRRG